MGLLLDELKNQFEKEDEIWKNNANCMLNNVSMALEKAGNSEKFEDFQKYYQEATAFADQLNALDTEHKKFLKDWNKKFAKAVFKDFLNNLKKGD